MLFSALVCGIAISFGICANINAQVTSCFTEVDGTACTDINAGISGACQGGVCSAINNPGASLGAGTPTGGTPGNTTGTPTGGTPGVQPSGTGIVIPTGTGLPAPPGGIAQIIRNLLTWLLGIVGVIAIIGFIISGIQYLTSAGDEDQMQSAKRNMLYAIIGVVVVLSSFVIIQAIQYALEAKSMF